MTTTTHPLGTRSARTTFNKAMRAKGLPAKVCGSCLVVKAHSAFAGKVDSPDGRSTKCRECASAAQAARLTDPEKRAAKRAADTARMADPAKRAAKRAADTARYADPENREKKRAYNRAYAADPANREKKRAADTARYADPENREKKRAADAARWKDPKVRARRNERNRERYANDPDYRARQLLRAAKRYRKTCREAHGAPEDNICHLCGLGGMTDENAHADHLKPRSCGGSDEGYNLRWAHASCNLRRSNRGVSFEQLGRILIPLVGEKDFARIVEGCKAVLAA